MIQLSRKGSSKEALFAQFISLIIEANENSADTELILNRPFFGAGLSHFLNNIPATSDNQEEFQNPSREQENFNAPCVFRTHLLLEGRALFNIILERHAEMFVILEFLFILYSILSFEFSK